MPRDEKPPPVKVSLLIADAIVKLSNPLPQLVQKPCGAQNRRAGFRASENPGCKPFSGGSCDQNIRAVCFFPQILRDTSR
jgi:hypothetical protein